MTTWTEESKNTTSWANQSESNVSYTLQEGAPIGLLLSLTYASTQVETGITWDTQTKS